MAYPKGRFGFVSQAENAGSIPVTALRPVGLSDAAAEEDLRFDDLAVADREQLDVAVALAALQLVLVHGENVVVSRRHDESIS
jgi:hypothetical protein